MVHQHIQPYTESIFIVQLSAWRTSNERVMRSFQSVRIYLFLKLTIVFI